MNKNNDLALQKLIEQINDLIANARDRALQTLGTVEVRVYWEIGQHLSALENSKIEHTENNNQLFSKLAALLSDQFQHDFDASDLHNIRAFFQTFPTWSTVRPELTWAHYCILLTLHNERVRCWYLDEIVAQNWSPQALQQLINMRYYERIITGRDHAAIKAEAHHAIANLTTSNSQRHDSAIINFLQPAKTEKPELEPDVPQKPLAQPADPQLPETHIASTPPSPSSPSSPSINKIFNLGPLPRTLRDGKIGFATQHADDSNKLTSITTQALTPASDKSNQYITSTKLSGQTDFYSAESEPIAISLKLIETETWHSFSVACGLKNENFADQLQKIGLASISGGEILPTRAAVILFADDPGSLLAAHGTRADIRLLVYEGTQIEPGATPNLRKMPKTLRGPLIAQINTTVKTLLEELAQGLTISEGGFTTNHPYPERVVREAIVNAIIHRDYGANLDIFIRLFDDRIEIENPGVFPANISPTNISETGSLARNPIIAKHLKEFPITPNLDAGEGVKMMFAEMARQKLYPPQYRQNKQASVKSISLTLLNLECPGIWSDVSRWIDSHGEIANTDLCKIGNLNTLAASRMLKAWVNQGVLVPLPGRAKRNMAYTKPALLY